MMFLGVKKSIQKSNFMYFKRGFAHIVPEPLVLKENKFKVAKITLNRPFAYNSFDMDTVNAFQEAVKEAEVDPKIQAIILRGNGKAFCSGGDVKYVLKHLKGDATNMTFRGHISACYNQIYRNSRLQTPLISFMDGITMGLGAGIAMYGPFRIVTEKTKYAMPEPNIGHFCDALCTHYLTRYDSCLAKYIIMTCAVLKGEDTLFAGVGTHFVPSANLNQLEEHLSKEPDLNHLKINNIIQEYSVDETHEPENHILNKENYAVIQKCFKFDNVSDIMNALEEDNFEFASNAIKAISKLSPVATVMNAENLRRSPNMSFIELMEMELTLWFRAAALHDFSEGIRSNIVLKQKPSWNPPTIKEVDINFLHQNIYQDGKAFDPTVYFPYDRTFTPENNFKYILPTRTEILKAQREKNLTTVEDTVQFFKTKTNNKFGIRQRIESMGLH